MAYGIMSTVYYIYIEVDHRFNFNIVVNTCHLQYIPYFTLLVDRLIAFIYYAINYLKSLDYL